MKSKLLFTVCVCFVIAINAKPGGGPYHDDESESEQQNTMVIVINQFLEQPQLEHPGLNSLTLEDSKDENRFPQLDSSMLPDLSSSTMFNDQQAQQSDERDLEAQLPQITHRITSDVERTGTPDIDYSDLQPSCMTGWAQLALLVKGCFMQVPQKLKTR